MKFDLENLEEIVKHFLEYEINDIHRCIWEDSVHCGKSLK
jgi:hypothetical protein